MGPGALSLLTDPKQQQKKGGKKPPVKKAKKSASDLKGKKRARSFPEKLMQAIMEHANEEAVAWLPDGKSFVIVSPEKFSSEVLSKIFKESKYSSFVRKLHRYVWNIASICRECGLYVSDSSLFDC